MDQGVLNVGSFDVEVENLKNVHFEKDTWSEKHTQGVLEVKDQPYWTKLVKYEKYYEYEFRLKRDEKEKEESYKKKVEKFLEEKRVVKHLDM